MDLRVPRVTLALTAVAVTLLALGLHRARATDPLSGDVHSPGAADQRALDLLDRAYVVGAVRVAGPDSVSASTIESDVVAHRRWYTVAGSLDTVVALLRANPPTGFAVSRQLFTEASSTGQGSGTIVEFQGANPASGSLDVAAVSLSDHRVSLRLEAVVGWTVS